MFEHWVTLFSAADAREASTVDWAAYRDTHENWPVREGFGTLVAKYGEGLPVSLSTPVSAIDWSGRPVRLATPSGTVEARAVILTVSTGTLAAEAIRFDPPLPAEKQSAIEDLPLGRANWVALAFDGNVFGAGHERFVGIWAPTQRTIGFTIRAGGANLALGFLGAHLSSELERAGPAAMADFAKQGVTTAFGADVARRVTATMSSAWESDPWIRGGYSAARPGCAHLRAALAAPVGDVLFFAGEATSPEFFSTVHGAYRSGERSVREVTAAWGRGSSAGEVPGARHP